MNELFFLIGLLILGFVLSIFIRAILTLDTNEELTKEDLE